MTSAVGRRVSARALVARLLVLPVVLVGMLVAMAAPALAHPALVSSSPGAGYAVTSAPAEVVLTFNEPVSLPDRPLTVRGADGDVRELRVALDAGGATLRGTPAAPLPEGAYEVSYRVIGRDGDTIAGTFRFGVATAVGAAVGGVVTEGAPERVQPATSLLRALLFLGLSLALGGAYLAWRVRAATGGLPAVRPLVRAGSLVALAGATGLLAALGPVSQVLQRASAPGVARLLVAEAVLLALAALTARRPGGAMPVTFLLGVVVFEAARAHPGEVSGAPGAALTVVHLLAGALWLGGLVHTLRLASAWRNRSAAVRVAVATYARNAFALFVLVAASGTLSALLLLPARADWTGTTYGQVLLVKLALFAFVVTAALLARARLRRTRRQPAGEADTAPGEVAAAAGFIAPGQSARRAPLGRAAGLEAALLAGVVLAAAAVTSVTPARLVPASSLLVAPVGATLRTAERIHQVSVSVVASEGRVEVRADAPDDGEPLAIAMAGRVSTAGGTERPLPLVSCGEFCWTGPVQWGAGQNALTFDVDAGRWRAGQVSIPVSWPVVPAPALLARVQTAMGARSTIDTAETVTSGFGVVVPHMSRRTGQEFLFGQPWAEGGATDAAVLEQGGQRTLLFALPALGYHFAMRLDAADRIVSERIVTPNHLLTREYRYP